MGGCGFFLNSVQAFFFNLPLTRPFSFMNHNTTKLGVGAKKGERSGIITLNRHLLGSLVKQLWAKGQIMSWSATVASPHKFKTCQQHVPQPSILPSHADGTAWHGDLPAMGQLSPWSHCQHSAELCLGAHAFPKSCWAPFPWLCFSVALMVWCTLQNTEALWFMLEASVHQHHPGTAGNQPWPLGRKGSPLPGISYRLVPETSAH